MLYQLSYEAADVGSRSIVGSVISLTLISFSGTYEPTIDPLIIIILIILTIGENYSLDRPSETHAKVVMKLFEAASWFC